MSNKNIMKNSELKDSKMKEVSGGAPGKGTAIKLPSASAPAPATAAAGGETMNVGTGGVGVHGQIGVEVGVKKFGMQTSTSGSHAKTESHVDVKF